MKIQKVNSTDYIIYIFSNLNKEEVKEKISKIQKRLKLRGFYKVLIINKNIGCFIKLIRLEDAFYKDTLDLKIEEVNKDIYSKRTDYFVVKNSSLVLYNDREYYALVDDSFDEIIEKVEFGDFVLDLNMDECYVI